MHARFACTMLVLVLLQTYSLRVMQSEEELKAGEAPDEEGEAELKIHTKLGKKCARQRAVACWS